MLIFSSALFAQDEKSYIHKGNEAYKQQKYIEAEADYKKSVDKKSQYLPGNFNLGDALYKQKKYDDATQKFTDIAGTSTNNSIKAEAYHNLGNSLLSGKKYQESIDAYKKSLLNNPKDDQTRYNLAYAQEMLKKQQQQNKQNKKNDQDKNKQNKDQNKNKKDNKDKSNKDKNKDQDKNNPDKKDQQNGQQSQPNAMSKEDAQRMLNALNDQEKNTQDKLKDKKLKGGKKYIAKDW